jgi:hypothetical protein
LNLQVLPIVLSKPSIEYSLYYTGKITDDGSLTAVEKTTTQYAAEISDMVKHGVVNSAVNDIDYTPNNKATKQMFTIRKQAGMDNTNIYFTTWDFPSIDTFSHYKNMLVPYGVKNLYAYGPDEKDLNDRVNRSYITAIHNAGGKVMDAQDTEQADSVADILDLAVVSGSPSEELANRYHSYGHKVYSYYNPQVVPEYPRLFRMNYGLLLWQRNYDGAMDFAYQWGFGDIWNDFDNTNWRDHSFAYPTNNGVIDTVQWEGFREGVDDVRYLTTLQNTIKKVKSQGKNTIDAEKYLTDLKKSDLTSQDLDAIRSQMINYILSLQD